MDISFFDNMPVEILIIVFTIGIVVKITSFIWVPNKELSGVKAKIHSLVTLLDTLISFQTLIALMNKIKEQKKLDKKEKEDAPKDSKRSS